MFTLSLPVSILQLLAKAKDNGDRGQLVVIASIAVLLLPPIVVLSAALLRGSARSMRRYRRSREPAITVPYAL